MANSRTLTESERIVVRAAEVMGWFKMFVTLLHPFTRQGSEQLCVVLAGLPELKLKEHEAKEVGDTRRVIKVSNLIVENDLVVVVDRWPYKHACFATVSWDLGARSPCGRISMPCLGTVCVKALDRFILKILRNC